MVWREIMHIDISILLEHNAFTCHFNIVNNILLVFRTIHVTINFSQKRQASATNGSSDFHSYWRLYSSLNTLSMIFLISLIVCAKHDNDVDCYDHEIKTHENAFVFPQKGYIFMHDLAPCHNSKRTRTFPECNGISIMK